MLYYLLNENSAGTSFLSNVLIITQAFIESSSTGSGRDYVVTSFVKLQHIISS